MSIFNVVMGQAVVHDDLRHHTLCTGWRYADDMIRSCSAVIMVNEQTSKGGLYHHPAGPLDRTALDDWRGATAKDVEAEQRAKAILDAMHQAIAPDRVHIFFGTFVTTAMPGAPVSAREQARGLELSGSPSLARYLRQLGCSPTLARCEAFGAMVTIDAHGVALCVDGHPPGSAQVVDLAEQPAGRCEGYVILGVGCERKAR